MGEKIGRLGTDESGWVRDTGEWREVTMGLGDGFAGGVGWRC